MLEIKVPAVGESINEVTLAKWVKQDGDLVQQDEVLCELESDKATFELNAEKPGKLLLKAKEGDVLKIGDVVCTIDTSVEVPAESEKKSAEKPKTDRQPFSDNRRISVTDGQPVSAPSSNEINAPAEKESYATGIASPAAEKMMRESGVSLTKGSGPAGRIIKEDVLNALKNGVQQKTKPFSREQRRVKMTPLRKTVSKHLVAAKNQTAMLTTFNEVDMKPIMDIRAKYKDGFKEKYGVNLGFMSFFCRACVTVLQEWPAVNAMIEGEELVYNDFVDIAIAVSTPKGLTTPVIRNAESLSMPELEQKVADLAKRGRDNKLTLEEMSGGTFTITNGGSLRLANEHPDYQCTAVGYSRHT